MMLFIGLVVGVAFFYIALGIVKYYVDELEK